ncbi:MAG: DUF5678 domain-containing protein [bacterium]|nr:DUF5678 domain-containing protein [bacterium]
MTVQLVKEKKYSGQYVALKSFEDDTVISSGDHVNEVYEKAAKKGHNDPVIIYVPKKDMVQVF